ncbi:MAG: signal peptidase II [Elusimicrobiota bacterium]
MRPATHRLIQPAVVLAVFALDRLTKAWALSWLAPRGSVRVLPFFHFSYIENTGAAWGMLQGGNTLLIGVAVALLGALLYLRRKWPEENLWSHYGLVLVAGGALGNLYDRIALGYVVDFLDFLVWPVFNVADSAITVGAVSLAWGLHLSEGDSKRQK